MQLFCRLASFLNIVVGSLPIPQTIVVVILTSVRTKAIVQFNVIAH